MFKTNVKILCALIFGALSFGAFSQNTENKLYMFDKGKHDISFAVLSNNQGQQVGMSYDLGDKPQKLINVSVFISTGKIDNVISNIRIYRIENKVPVDKGFTQFIPEKIGDWNTINLEKLGMTFTGIVIVAVEWVTPTGEKEPFSSFLIGADINVINHNGFIKNPNSDWYPARRFGQSGPKNFYIRLETKSI
jgi:hypothetical protein